MRLKEGANAGRNSHQIGMMVALSIATLLADGAVAADIAAPPGLAGLNTREARADRVWELRAALNVAALQCQFSPFLAAVPNYNALLRQHSDEMADAFKSMTGYFVRTKGRTGQRAFDSYATRTNQSWATFDGKISFCDAAAMVGRRALAVPKGQFGDFAAIELDGLRSSLKIFSANPAILSPHYEWAIVPKLKDPCAGRSRCR